MVYALVLFLAGIGSCFGVCGLVCSPIILPYIAMQISSFSERLKSFAMFIVAKTVTQVFLGIIIIVFGQSIIRTLSYVKSEIFIIVGGLIILLGLVMIFTREKVLCYFLPTEFLLKRKFEIYTLGIFMGLFPCLPKLGIFSSIAFSSKNALDGVKFMAIYTSGEILSLFVLLNILHLFITKIVTSKLRVITAKIFGIIITVLGARLIYMGIK